MGQAEQNRAELNQAALRCTELGWVELSGAEPNQAEQNQWAPTGSNWAQLGRAEPYWASPTPSSQLAGSQPPCAAATAASTA